MPEAPIDPSLFAADYAAAQQKFITASQAVWAAFRRHFYLNTLDWKQMVLFRTHQCIA